MSFSRFPLSCLPEQSGNYMPQSYAYGSLPMRNCHPPPPGPAQADFGRCPYPRPPHSGPRPFADRSSPIISYQPPLPPPVQNFFRSAVPPGPGAQSLFRTCHPLELHPPNFSQPPPFQVPPPSGLRPSVPPSNSCYPQPCPPGPLSSYTNCPAPQPSGQPPLCNPIPPYSTSSKRPRWRAEECHSASPQFQVRPPSLRQPLRGSAGFPSRFEERSRNWRPQSCPWKNSNSEAGCWRDQNGLPYPSQKQVTSNSKNNYCLGQCDKMQTDESLPE